MKKLLAILLCLVMACSIFAGFAAEEAEGTLDAIKEKGTLVMLTNAEFVPYEYIGEGNAVAGIDVDICQAIADALEVELEVVNMDFDGLIAALSAGKGDLVAAGLTVTEERALAVDFTNTYADAKQLMIVNKDDPKVASEEELDGKVVGVQLGTTGDIYMEQNFDSEVRPYKSGLDAALDLSNGRLDAVVIDELPAQSIVEANDDLALVEMPNTADEQYAIAVKKGDASLLDALNEIIDQLIEEGKIAEFTAFHVEAVKGAEEE